MVWARSWTGGLETAGCDVSVSMGLVSNVDEVLEGVFVQGRGHTVT